MKGGGQSWGCRDARDVVNIDSAKYRLVIVLARASYRYQLRLCIPEMLNEAYNLFVYDY